ncbi:MAG: hypothetical protein IE916_03955 [Epsilonproteobacteria bacterium]|nr:hypothetical protein [Campylobacterota bacterium]
MTKEEALDYYDEHWNDYNAIYSMLHELFDSHERQMAMVRQEAAKSNASAEITKLEEMLRECQDRLDEETHKLEKFEPLV